MRTRRSILRSRDESSDQILREEAQLGAQATTSLPRNENGLLRQLRTKLTLEADRRNPPVSQFNNELHVLKQQNLQLKRGRADRPPVGTNSTPCRSTDTLFSGMTPGMTPSGESVRSCPATSEYPSTSAADSSGFTHPLNTLSLLPRPRRRNVLETLVRAFPITIPTEEFVNFVDAKGCPDLTEDMKRYFVDRKNQHKTEFERCVSVFKSERPWEPKWFTQFLGRLLASTKARPSVYQYMFDLRQRKEESKVLQYWKNMSAFLKWTIFAISLGMYFVFLCFLIEMNGDDGVNMTVPVTLIITIIINKLLVNMNSSIPGEI